MFNDGFIRDPPDPRDPPDLVPSVRAPDIHHQPEDIVPRLSLHHRLVREHAAVPAGVLDVPRRLATLVAQPEARVTHDIELAVRIERQAVASGIVVRTRSKDSRV